MLERSGLVLRAVCLALALLMLYQVAHLAARPNPLRDIKMPAAPPAAPASAAAERKLTNAPPAAPAPAATQSKLTNAPPVSGSNPVSRLPGRRGPSGPGPGGPGPELAPPFQAAVDRIIQSEIFGPVPRPMPMALLGVAGKDAFIRGPNGQTGLVREGEEFGGLKLLQIGTNRVLIEHEGQKKELTIFAGLGSESLLPKGKETPQ